MIKSSQLIYVIILKIVGKETKNSLPNFNSSRRHTIVSQTPFLAFQVNTKQEVTTSIIIVIYGFMIAIFLYQQIYRWVSNKVPKSLNFLFFWVNL